MKRGRKIREREEGLKRGETVKEMEDTLPW